MAKIRDLPIDPALRGQLRDAEFETSDDLWRKIGTDFPTGLDKVAHSTGIDADRLLHVLGAAAAETRRQFTFLEALLCLGLAALMVLAVSRIAEGLGFADFPAAWMSESMEQVVANADLPAFRVLTEEDLGQESRPRTEKGLTKRQKAVGSYLLRPLRKGGVLRAGDLGSVEIQGRWIVDLSLPSARLGPLVEPGSAVLLILSPRRGAAQAAVEVAASILDVRRNGETALVTVALPADRRQEIAAVLATSEVFFTRTP